MWIVNHTGSVPMPEPKPLTTFAETTVRTHYGRRTLQWIGDRLGCSPVTVLSYAEQLGLWKPTGVVSAVTAVGEVSDDLLTPLHEAVGAVNAAAYEALRVGYAVTMRAGSNGAVLEFDISEMDNSREAESLVNEPKWKRHWHGD